MEDTRKNLKVPLTVWRLLRQIAAATDSTHVAVLERVLATEWQRLQQHAPAPPKGS